VKWTNPSKRFIERSRRQYSKIASYQSFFRTHHRFRTTLEMCEMLAAQYRIGFGAHGGSVQQLQAEQCRSNHVPYPNTRPMIPTEQYLLRAAISVTVVCVLWPPLVAVSSLSSGIHCTDDPAGTELYTPFRTSHSTGRPSLKS
jgi:hypothetical protein